MTSLTVALAQYNPTVGALESNANKMLSLIDKAKEKGADLIVFPELSLTGYPPEDLLTLPFFLDEVERVFKEFQKKISGVAVLIGLPRRNPSGRGKFLFNSAALIQNGQPPLYFDKQLLPTYDVFDESRYFEPGKGSVTFTLKGKKIGVTICEDIWGKFVDKTHYEKDPIDDLLKHSPLDFVVNLSASPYSLKKQTFRMEIARDAAARLSAPIYLCNQVGGNDSLLFDGGSFAIDAKGKIFGLAPTFEESLIIIADNESCPLYSDPQEDGEELFKALVMGLKDYFYKTGARRACLGLSGGIDSAVVACIAREALGKENVLALGMPSRFSSESSKTDARGLSQSLGIEYQEISIESIFTSSLELLEPFFAPKGFDITEENLQSRIRALILMAFANKWGYFALSTSNKSEAALGYTTLYGDAIGALAVIGDLNKAQVYQVARAIQKRYGWISASIFDKPPSAELRPNQKDSDSLPDYAIVDAVVDAYVEDEKPPQLVAKEAGCSLSLAQELIRKIHLSEYKRRQIPFALRISEKSFSSGRRFPIAQGFV